MNEPVSAFVREPDENLRAALLSWLVCAGCLVSDSLPAPDAGDAGCPDVVLLGLDADPAGNMRVLAGLRAAVPRARIVVLHGAGQERAVLEALRGGAWGHLCREGLGVERLLAAVRLVARGEPLISPRVAGLMLDAVQSGSPNTDPSGAHHKRAIE